MKTIILTFALTIIIYNTQAQVLKSIGLKGGMSLANQSFEYKTDNSNLDFDYKLGVYNALTAEFFNTKHVSLVTDLGFVQKGKQIDVQKTTLEMPEGTGEFETWKSTLNYLTFSPMLKGFYNINKFTGYAFIGPRIDYRLSYDSKYYAPLYEDSKKQIFGLNYGVGLAYHLNKISLSTEFMAQPDLTPMLDTEPSVSNIGLKVKSNAYVFNVGVGYRFR